MSKHKERIEELEQENAQLRSLFYDTLVEFGAIGLVASNLPLHVRELVAERDRHRRVVRHVSKALRTYPGMIDYVQSRDHLSPQEARERVSTSLIKSITQQINECLRE